MKEADLKLTWCPFARVPLPVQQHVRGMGGSSPVDTVSVNRNADGSLPAAARCIGSACSQYRWRERDFGAPQAYCGAAGEP